MKSIHLGMACEDAVVSPVNQVLKNRKLDVGDVFYLYHATANGRERMAEFDRIFNGYVEKLYQSPTVPNWGYMDEQDKHQLTLFIYRRIK